MCERKLESTVPKRLRISELNPHLLCALCGGYLIDATTIIECLHAFCKTCILRYLETSNYCPICEVLIHKTRPWQNIRLDHSLQNAVYKMVPGLFQNEMRRRREFYHKQNQTDKRGLTNSQPQEELGDRIIFSQDEEFSISIEFSPDGKPVPDTTNTSAKGQKCLYHQDKRYLKCPAALRIEHLKKFIRAKFSLPQNIQIDLFREKEPLCDTYSLMDVAYIYNWKRDCVLRLFYSFYEVPPKVRKLEAALSVTETVGKKSKDKEKKDGKTEKRKEERKFKCKKEKSKERKQCQVSGKACDSGGKATPNIASPKAADAQKSVKASSSVKTLQKRKHPDSDCFKKSVQAIKHDNTCVKSHLTDSGQQTDPYQTPPPVKEENPCIKNLEADSVEHTEQHAEQPCQPSPAKQKCLPQAASYSIVKTCGSEETTTTSKESPSAVKSSLKLLIKSSDLKSPKTHNGPSAVKDKKQKTSGSKPLSLQSNLFERMGSFAKYSFSEHLDSSTAPIHVLSSPSQSGKSPLNAKRTKVKDIKYDLKLANGDNDVMKHVKNWSKSESPGKIEKKPTLNGNKVVKAKESCVATVASQNGVDFSGDASEYKKVEPVSKVLDGKVHSFEIVSGHDSCSGKMEQEPSKVKSEPGSGSEVHKESTEPLTNHMNSDLKPLTVDTKLVEKSEKSDNGPSHSVLSDHKTLPEVCAMEPASKGETAPAGAVKPEVPGLEAGGICKPLEKSVVENNCEGEKLEENNVKIASGVRETEIKQADKLHLPVNQVVHGDDKTASKIIEHSLDLKTASQDANNLSDMKSSNEVQSKQSTVTDAQKSIIVPKCNVPETKDVKPLELPSEAKGKVSSEVENVPIATPSKKFFSLKPKIFDRSSLKIEQKDKNTKSELSTIFKEKSVNHLKLGNGKGDKEKSLASDGFSQDSKVTTTTCVQDNGPVHSKSVQKKSPPKMEPSSTTDEKNSKLSKTTADSSTAPPAPPKLLKTITVSTSSSSANSITVSHSIASIVSSPSTSLRSTTLYPSGLHLSAATSVIASTTNTASVSLSGSASSAVSNKSVTSLSFTSTTATKPSPTATPVTSVSSQSLLKPTDLSKTSGMTHPSSQSQPQKQAEKPLSSQSTGLHSSSFKLSLPSSGSVSSGPVSSGPVSNGSVQPGTSPGTKSLSYTDALNTDVSSDVPATIDNTFLITPPEEKKSPVLVNRTSPNITQTSNSSVKVPKEVANLDNFLFDTKPSEKDILISTISPEFKDMTTISKQSLKNSARTRIVSATEAQNLLNEKSLKKLEPQITAIHNLPKTISQASKYSVTRSVIVSTSPSTRPNSSVIQTTKISTLIPKSNSVTSKSGMYSKGFSYPASINNVPSSRSFLHTTLPPHVSRSITTLVNGSADYERAMTNKTPAMISHSGTKISSPTAPQHKPVSQQKVTSSRHSSKASEAKHEKAQKVKSIPPLTIPKASFVSTTLKLQRSPGSTDHYIFAPLSHYSASGHHNGEHRSKTKEKHNGPRTPASPPTSNKESLFAGERQRVPTIKISDINRNPIIVDSGSNHLSSYRSYCHSTSRSATLENGTNRAHARGGSESSSPNGGNDNARSSARDSRRPSDSELLMNPHWHGYPTADLLFNGFKLPSHAKFHDLHYDTDAMPLDYSQSSSKS